MSKTNLTDITFLIPIRIDSNSRLINLNLVTEFIKKNFNTTILVLEANKSEQVQHPLIDRKFFVKDDNPIFHRTKYLNKLIKESNTDLIAVWDADVLVDCSQIIEAESMLCHEKMEVVFPYDGHFYKVPEMIRSIYKERRDFDIFVKNQQKFLLYYWQHFYGGAFIVNRKAYIEGGMENENFYGWGPEDEERVKRWEILGFKIKRVNGPMYHLDHPRINSWFASKEIEIQNRNEFRKICEMNKDQLIAYINTFEWCKFSK